MNSQEILKENPDDLEALKILAKCSMEFGRIPAWSTTLMCTEKILNQKPDDFDAKILRIKALRKLGKDLEASLLLDRVEKTEPDSPIVLSLKSSILLDEAIDLSNKSTVSPSVVKGHKNLCVKNTSTLYDPTAITPSKAR